MSLLTALRDTYSGFKSLLTGLRITAREASKPSITVQYPHETLKMPERFRGHVKLVLDPVTGKSRCTSCNLCVRACPSDCITVEGIKREGEKKKSVSEYTLDFTTCSLCGSCVEACPSDAIEYSKDYNVVSLHREDFSRMDLVKKLEAEAKVWAEKNPEAAAAAAAASAAAMAAAAAAPAKPAVAPAPASAATPTPTSTPAAAANPVAPVRSPEPKTT
ncbi:MAG: NADH-quinone oxidoreductase subunit I [Opitutaceae bacterium]|nr:NADH-quinone oxidoreductase subunit I [Opitutaceae bacterium]